MNLEQKDTTQLNQFDSFFGFVVTDFHKIFFNSEARIRACFTGNQAFKTSSSMYDLTLRLMGSHPVPRRNVDYYECEEGHLFNIPKFKKLTLNQNDQNNLKCPECSALIKLFVGPIRRIRLGSENLPVDTSTASEGGISVEGKNTQYPELKKWLPHFLIGKDITARKPWMTVRNVHGLPDIMVEFVSYSQTIQSQAGVQLKAAYLDEEPPYDFLEETRPRLIHAEGDIVFALTPANRITYLHDEVFEKASIVYRTQAVADRLKLRDPNKNDYALIEYHDSGKDIHVFQAATDDNPILTIEQVNKAFDDIDDELDPEVIDIRRYGLFRQQSGRIYKGLSKVHILKASEHFEDGMPSHWTHGRAIDYHPHVAWHHAWMVISPNDEAFIYDELILNPESYPTKEQMFHNVSKSRNYQYTVSLVDPLASTNQVNSGKTTIQDMNEITHDFHREGFGTGGYWESWDTKGSRGREEIRMRLKNAARVGKPFNNLVMEKDLTGAERARRLPTLWIMSNCVKSIEYMGRWRLQEHKDRDAKVTKEQKEAPQEKWSHLCMCYEALFKSPAFRARQEHSGKSKAGPYDNYYRRRR